MFVVVFGILGATIFVSRDPLEQINRAKDVSLSTNTHFLSYAIKEHYKRRHAFPWPEGTLEGGDISAVSAVGIRDQLNVLVTEKYLGEEILKSDDLSEIEIFKNKGENFVRVCFSPHSKAFRDQARDKGCGDLAGVDGCYWCLK